MACGTPDIIYGQPTQQIASTPSKRAITAKDIIEMTGPGENLYSGGILNKEAVAIWSPDQTRFVTVTKRGNLDADTNIYSVVLFSIQHRDEVSHGIKLISMASASTRPAIQSVAWLDGHTISFLGETPSTLPQVYTLDVNTKYLKELTYSKTGGTILAYTISTGLKEVIFTRTRARRTATTKNKDGGFVVDNQSLDTLLTGDDFVREEGFDGELCVQRFGAQQEERISLYGSVAGWIPLYLSPNGKTLIVKTLVSKTPPKWWEQYENASLRRTMQAGYREGNPQFIYQFESIDLVSKKSHLLLTTPIPEGDYPDVIYSPDSKSVALSMVYLSIEGVTDLEQNIRRTTRFAVEVNMTSGDVTPITSESIHFHRWEANGGLIGRAGRYETGAINEGSTISFVKRDGSWLRATDDNSISNIQTPLRITLEQDMNSPPKLVATNATTGARQVVFDLNPQFRELAFGEVRDLGVINGRGRPVTAGIYLPVGYREGVKYPLVIQTHGWDTEKFWIDGPFSTACAAQALAGAGFIVAQIDFDHNDPYTLQNLKEEMGNYEHVIDYLNDRGMIDPARIGIVGFSITGPSVRYALVHSRYRFGAATIADASDSGYFYYIANLNSNAVQTLMAERINGGAPIGSGLQLWIGSGVDFGIERATAPVRLEANHPGSLLLCWETFGILKHVGKPVDLIYMPDDSHVLVKPRNRLTSQGGNVDWFRFWLQDYEDPNPSKSEQYQRWEHLRDLRDADNKAADNTSGEGAKPKN